jgi:mRNA interferase YafQ
MYVLKRSSRFKKDFKKICGRREFKENIFIDIIGKLQRGISLPVSYENHKLHGEFVGCMECHVQFDILLIYAVEEKAGIVHLLRIGTHPDLF